LTATKPAAFEETDIPNRLSGLVYGSGMVNDCPLEPTANSTTMEHRINPIKALIFKEWTMARRAGVEEEREV
jgi:hypothetical protein